MTIQNKPHGVGARVNNYLKKVESAVVREFVDDAVEYLPDTVIFGGMIRDFALGGVREFASDIDLVSMASREEIRIFISKYNPQANKFGGFRFVVGGQMFDIWSFNDTWAFKQGLVKASGFHDLCKTTFFNVDAACKPLNSTSLISDEDYLESLECRLLDINLEQNPAPNSIAARAIRMAITKNLRMSSRLQEYVLKYAEASLWIEGLTKTYLSLVESHLNSCPGKPFEFEPQVELF